MLSMPSPISDVAIPAAPILVVDDDAKIVRLVRTYLERDGFMVVTASDGPGALDAIERHAPALVVLDLMLPGLDGRAVIRAVRRDDESGRTADPRPVGAQLDPRPDRGTRGRRRRLSAQTVLAGRARPSREVDPAPDRAVSERAGSSRRADDPLRRPDVDPARHEVRRGDTAVDLTPVEFKLLSAILAADGRVLSRDQLLDAVYGHESSDILDRTIDVHIRRLRDKLDDDPDAPRYVQTVRGVGYRAART
jgi:DNA-binding response OmpR family regulator